MQFYKRKAVFALSFALTLAISQPVMASDETFWEDVQTIQDQATEQITSTTTEQSEKTSKAKQSNISKKKKQKNKKDKKKDEKKKKRNIKAPEDIIKKQSAMVVDIKKEQKKKLKGLLNERENLLHAQQVNQAIRSLYGKLDQISKKEALPVEVLLTGVKKENTVAADYNVNRELTEVAVLEDGYLDQILKEYTFGAEGGISMINTMKEEDVVQLKPYLDKMLAATGQSEDKREDEIQKLNKKIKTKKKEISDLKPEEERVFDPTDLLKVSNLSTEEIRYILKGTALEELASAFHKCEETYGVNAVAIMGIAIHESAWGTSRRAREDNNLTGYGVTSDSAKGINANTKEKNLLMTAKLLAEKYLIKEGVYYYKAPSIIGVNYHYCVGDEWAAAVTDYGYQLMEKLE